MYKKIHNKLTNQDLKDIDPFDENLTLIQKNLIINECIDNVFYFFTKCVKIISQYDGEEYHFNLDKRLTAILLCYEANRSVIITDTFQSKSGIFNFCLIYYNIIFKETKCLVIDKYKNLNEYYNYISRYIKFPSYFDNNINYIKYLSINYINEVLNNGNIRMIMSQTNPTSYPDNIGYISIRNLSSINSEEINYLIRELIISLDRVNSDKKFISIYDYGTNIRENKNEAYSNYNFTIPYDDDEFDKHRLEAYFTWIDFNIFNSGIYSKEEAIEKFERFCKVLNYNQNDIEEQILGSRISDIISFDKLIPLIEENSVEI